MATTFTAFVWPPLLFQKPVNTGLLATLKALVFPPEVFPNPTNVSKIGTAPAPTFPPQVLPSSPVSSVQFQPTAPVPNKTTYVNPFVTQAATYKFFKIQSPTPGSGT